MTNRTDDLSDPVGRSIDQIRRRVKPVDGDSLVHRVQGHLDVRSRRRRRTIRIAVTSGCAAVILVVIAAVAFRFTDRGPTHVVRSVLTTADDGPTVRVEPSTNLSDGQRVQVTAYGFDADTTVDFFSCMAAADLGDVAPETSGGDQATSWVCQGRLAPDGTLDTVDAPAVPSSDDDPTSPGDDRPTRATAHFTAAVTGDPLVGIDTRGSISIRRWVLGADITVPPCGPHRAASDTPETSSTAPVRTLRCRIVAVGTIDGEPRVVPGDPLDFASTMSPEATTTSSGPVPPSGTVRVRPSTGLRSQQDVTVTATGFDAGTRVTFLECIVAYADPQVIFADDDALHFDPRWVCLGPTTNQANAPTQATATRRAGTSGPTPSSTTRAPRRR